MHDWVLLCDFYLFIYLVYTLFYDDSRPCHVIIYTLIGSVCRTDSRQFGVFISLSVSQANCYAKITNITSWKLIVESVICRLCGNY